MNKKQHWSVLQPGDVVDVIAPGSKVTKDELAGAVRFLRRWGLQARIPKDLFGRDVICSNSDEKRWQHLKLALTADDSKVVWCLRGGYGANRLLPRLGRLKKPRRPKLIIGFSDVTSLHIVANCEWNWPSLHGPMLGSLGSRKHPPSVLRELKNMLFGWQSEITFQGLKPLNQHARKKRLVHGSVVGGNMMTIQSCLGTPWQIQTEGRILFLEEINERGYRVDRMLEHLAQAGTLKKVQAVVFGEFIGGQEPDGRQQWKPVLQRFADEANFPVLRGIRSGHGHFQRPIPFHTPAQLLLGPAPKMICQSGGVLK